MKASHYQIKVQQFSNELIHSQKILEDGMKPNQQSSESTTKKNSSISDRLRTVSKSQIPHADLEANYLPYSSTSKSPLASSKGGPFEFVIPSTGTSLLKTLAQPIIGSTSGLSSKSAISTNTSSPASARALQQVLSSVDLDVVKNRTLKARIASSPCLASHKLAEISVKPRTNSMGDAGHLFPQSSKDYQVSKPSSLQFGPKLVALSLKSMKPNRGSIDLELVNEADALALPPSLLLPVPRLSELHEPHIKDNMNETNSTSSKRVPQLIWTSPSTIVHIHDAQLSARLPETGPPSPKRMYHRSSIDLEIVNKVAEEISPCRPGLATHLSPQMNFHNALTASPLLIDSSDSLDGDNVAVASEDSFLSTLFKAEHPSHTSIKDGIREDTSSLNSLANECCNSHQNCTVDNQNATPVTCDASGSLNSVANARAESYCDSSLCNIPTTGGSSADWKERSVSVNPLANTSSKSYRCETATISSDLNERTVRLNSMENISSKSHRSATATMSADFDERNVTLNSLANISSKSHHRSEAATVNNDVGENYRSLKSLVDEFNDATYSRSAYHTDAMSARANLEIYEIDSSQPLSVHRKKEFSKKSHRNSNNEDNLVTNCGCHIFPVFIIKNYFKIKSPKNLLVGTELKAASEIVSTPASSPSKSPVKHSKSHLFNSEDKSW